MTGKSWLGITVLLLSIIGVLDTSYLTAEFLFHGQVACSIVSGCNEVLGSRYSHLGPVPVAAVGLAYYLALAILAALFLQTSSFAFIRTFARITILGVLVSFVLLYLQVFVIHAICLYCVISAAITLVLFGFAQFILRFYN